MLQSTGLHTDGVDAPHVSTHSVLSGDFNFDVIDVVRLLLVVDIAIVLFVASEIWYIVDSSIALIGNEVMLMKKQKDE